MGYLVVGRVVDGVGVSCSVQMAQHPQIRHFCRLITGGARASVALFPLSIARCSSRGLQVAAALYRIVRTQFLFPCPSFKASSTWPGSTPSREDCTGLAWR